MLKSSVKEHVAEKLVPAEIVGEEEMQAEFVRQIYSVQGGNLLSGKEQNIYYKQVLCYCGNVVHIVFV